MALSLVLFDLQYCLFVLYLMNRAVHKTAYWFLFPGSCYFFNQYLHMSIYWLIELSVHHLAEVCARLRAPWLCKQAWPICY